MFKRLALSFIACWLCTACVGLHAQSAAARPQFVYVLRVLPPFHAAQAWSDKESTTVGKHFERLVQATAKGQLILAGKTNEPLAATFGIVIFEADNEQAARQFMEDDPAVLAGLMSVAPGRPKPLTAPSGGRSEATWGWFHPSHAAPLRGGLAAQALIHPHSAGHTRCAMCSASAVPQMRYTGSPG